MNHPPAIEISFNELPQNPQERHEFLVEVFGQYFVWALNHAMKQANLLVESDDARRTIGRIRAKPFAEIAEHFSEEQRHMIHSFARQTLELFARNLLLVLTAQGISHPMGTDHAVQFRLILDICDKENLDVVFSEVLNRGGAKVFDEYLNRWIYRDITA